MKIKYLAHSAFLITTGGGVKIITDPYAVAGPFKYQPINETADIVTVSHEHGDHNYVKAVKGNPVVFRDSGEAKGFKFTAMATAHDENDGAQRGLNKVFCFSVDGINVCHCGDLGHVLTPEQVKALGKVDVLLLPVGGFFTIDAAAAAKVWQMLKPAVTVPMHYKTEKADMPIAGVEEFTKGKIPVSFINASEIELDKDKLPQAPQIVVLQPELF
jgi:L-ascorbate metabolism protein UlaG (beta-lactamase superfamily)